MTPKPTTPPAFRKARKMWIPDTWYTREDLGLFVTGSRRAHTTLPVAVLDLSPESLLAMREAVARAICSRRTNHRFVEFIWQCDLAEADAVLSALGLAPARRKGKKCSPA